MHNYVFLNVNIQTGRDGWCFIIIIVLFLIASWNLGVDRIAAVVVLFGSFIPVVGLYWSQKAIRRANIIIQCKNTT